MTIFLALVMTTCLALFICATYELTCRNRFRVGERIVARARKEAWAKVCIASLAGLIVSSLFLVVSVAH